MQKLINVLALLSFAGVAGIVGGGVYVYTQKDAIIESVTQKALGSIGLPGGIGGGALGGAVDSIPDMSAPDAPSLPVPSTGPIEL